MAIIFDGTQGITTPAETANNSVTTPVVKSGSALTLQTNGSTTAVTIDTNQRVGIGQTSPTSGCLLDVKGGDIRVENTSGAVRVRLVGGSNQYSLETSSGTNALQFIDAAAGLERMRIDSGGRITKPYQPAFCAKGMPSVISSGVALFGSSSIPLNVGSSYSQATGRFTAPIAGNYLFIIVGMAQNLYYTADVRVNASSFAEFRTNDGSIGNYMQGTISLIIPLATSDYVDVSVRAGNFGGNAQEIIFGGYLLG